MVRFVLDVLEAAVFEKPNAWAPYGWISQASDLAERTREAGPFGTVLFARRKVCGCAIMFAQGATWDWQGRSLGLRRSRLNPGCVGVCRQAGQISEGLLSAVSMPSFATT